LNDRPVITGLAKALSTPEETALTLKLSDLQVTDADNNYPVDFTLKVESGSNYTVVGAVITPAANFTGELTVPVRVNDGSVDSDVFNVKITVTPLNDRPVITGLVKSLSTPEETALTLKLSDLQVTDADNNYPADFTLKVQSGSNYTVVGAVITPAVNFTGELTVPVRVNDGTVDSDVFNVKITVTPLNDRPVITGLVKSLSTPEETSFTLNMSNLLIIGVTDIRSYQLFIQAGENYTVKAESITPVKDFTGILKIPVMIGNGTLNSNVYELLVEVTPVNDAPIIVDARQQLVVAAGKSLEIELQDLVVQDVDNEYPNDFSLVIMDGQGYSHEGNTIIAEAVGGSREIIVPIMVNDGTDNSNVYNLKVTVKSGRVDVYPNPANKVVNIRFDSEDITTVVQLRLMSVKGEVVRTFITAKNTETLDYTLSLEGLNNGVYILEISQGTYKTARRLVKY
jgi:hypothetical protein